MWTDIRTLAEQLIEADDDGYGLPTVAPHFLGAVVLDQQLHPAGFIAVRHIIDGQQRLTTLQLLLDAAQLVVAKHGAPRDAQALRVLILNDPAIAQDPDEVFKVWPTDRDQDASRAAMDDASTMRPELAGARIAQGHGYFHNAIKDWAASTDGAVTRQRLNALVRHRPGLALARLVLVVIFSPRGFIPAGAGAPGARSGCPRGVPGGGRAPRTFL